MPAPKRSEKFWFAALAASLLLNAWFYFNKSDKAEQVLAQAQGRSFRWKDVSDPAKLSFRNLDLSYYRLLKNEAERWAENLVLPKEAEARGVSVEELLRSEVTAKVQVGPEEAQRRYAKTPSADTLPWPTALEQVRADLYNERYRSAKDAFLKSLFDKYGVRFRLEPPAAAEAGPKDRYARFPVYEPPADASLPSRGPAGAPLVIEIYSDFHCPFSKKFASTLAELEKGYPDKIRQVFHHFPLPIHPDAPAAHQAAVCAQEQGKFWEFHDRLMAAEGKPDKADLSVWAGELGMNGAAFEQCLASGKAAQAVSAESARGRAQGVRSTPTFLVNGRLLSGAMPPEALKPILDWHLNPAGRYPGAAQDAPPPSAPRLDPSKVHSFDAGWVDKGPSKGPAGAPVTVIEFFDYNCPFCQKGAEVSDKILAAYPGKVRIVSKQLPLPMHPNAAKAAEALLCAHEQGKFWPLRQELFGASWGKQTSEDLKAASKKAGLDASKFNACLDSSKMRPAVEEDVRVATALGRTGTPTFFINGTPVVGAQPFESFKKVIDEKLAAGK